MPVPKPPVAAEKLPEPKGLKPPIPVGMIIGLVPGGPVPPVADEDTAVPVPAEVFEKLVPVPTTPVGTADGDCFGLAPLGDRPVPALGPADGDTMGFVPLGDTPVPTVGPADGVGL